MGKRQRSAQAQRNALAAQRVRNAIPAQNSQTKRPQKQKAPIPKDRRE
jgi:hypothetical protein